MSTTTRIIAAIIAVVAVGIVALRLTSPGTANEAASETVTTPTHPAAVVTTADPDTTGEAIWAHLQEENYAEEWELWPDKGRKYEGQKPHGARLTTLLNDVAYEALMSDASSFPDGSIVVKRNFTPNGDLAAVTTMFKAEGYNEEHADWFFTKHLPSGELDEMPNGMKMEGRLPGCQNCHMAKADNDYIFTGQLAD